MFFLGEKVKFVARCKPLSMIYRSDIRRAERGHRLWVAI